MVRPSSTCAVFDDVTSAVIFDAGHQSMSRSPRASRFPVEACGEMGIGEPMGLTTVMVEEDRRPFRSR